MENSLNTAPQVIEALQSADSATIRSAAFSAGDMALHDAIPLLCALVKSSNIGIQEAAEYALRKIRGPHVVTALLPLLRSEEAPVRNVAMDILREIGGDSIESMQTYLQDEDPDLRIFITDILGYSPTHQAALLLAKALLKDPEVNVRYQAAVSLGNLAFPETVPPLCQAMHDEEWVQFAVVEALAKIKDPSAANGLVKLLPQASQLVSSAIIDALGGMGDIKAIPLLFSSLENVSVPLRHKIVKAIVQILSVRSLSLLAAKSQERLRVYLLEALTDNDEDILLAALQGLSAIGNENATEAIINLATSLDAERQPELYEAAIHAIASLGYNTMLRDALRSEDEKRISIAMAACRLLNDHSPAEELKNIFWRVSPELRRAAVAEVAQMGECTDTPFFLSIIEDSDDAEVLKSALVFFGNQHTCPEVEDIVFSQLDHRYVDVQEMALEACINLHSPKLNILFKERARNEDPMQRMMAIYALGRYSVTENLDEIIQALEDSSPRVRQVAIEAFQNLGPQAEDFLPSLLPRLLDEDKDVRIALVDLLGQIGTGSVMPHIISALADENDWVKIRAIEALGVHKIVDAVPYLAQMFETENPMVSFKIIEALGMIGGNMAFSVLLSLMDNEDQEIQHATAEAVAAIQAEQE